MSPPLIQIRSLVKKFGKDAAVNGVSLDIYDKEFLALLGPSGCGKTTLLRMLGGFENPTAGEILMDGKDLTRLPPNKRPLNMVFQSYAVFPHMNVQDNIAYGLRMDGVGKEEIKQRVQESLSLVRLESYATRFSHQLSGGQRQRVALARALVKRPRVLLLDEPLSALDAKLREAMQTELVKLQHTVGITFVVVTHDQDEALSMAERIAVMKDGEIKQLDSPRNLYEAPTNQFVADFIGRMNIVAAKHIDNNRYAADNLGEVFAADNNQQAAFVAIRPAYIAIASAAAAADNQFVAEVDNISYYGGETVLTVKTTQGAIFTVILPNQNRNAAAPNIGQQIVIGWTAADMITLAE